MPGIPFFYGPSPYREPQRHSPTIYCPPIPGSGMKGCWDRNGRRVQIKKPHYAWIWPKDKPKLGKWDRIKDCLQGAGPDMHITIGAEKGDHMWNRQTRNIWGNHLNLDDRGRSDVLKPDFDPRRRYDFYHRKYMMPHRQMCTDAVWHGPKDNPYPQHIRDRRGVWWDDVGRGRDPFGCGRRDFRYPGS